MTLDRDPPLVAPFDPGRVDPAPGLRFQSATRFAQAIAWVMRLTVMVDVLSIVRDSILIDVATHDLSREAPEHAVLDVLAGGKLAYATFILFIAAVVLFCLFISRANWNAWAFGGPSLRYTPLSSVGVFFVPILNLYAPYLAVRELWRASDPDSITHVGTGRVPLLVSMWWVLLLLCAVVTLLSFVLNNHIRNTAEFIAAESLEIAVALTSAAVALAAIPTVRGLARRQDQRQAAVARGAIVAS